MKQLNWYQIFGKSNIPDGRTVLPTDDIQIWLNCANIWDKTYTTLAEVLADTDTLSALIASENAVDYMVRSTTWVAIPLVPIMTSNTTPSGVCSSSSVYSNNLTMFSAYKAFDGDDSSSNGLAHTQQLGNQWIEYRFDEAVVVHKVHYKGQDDVYSSRSPLGYIQGSNDGVTYTNIKSVDYRGSQIVDDYISNSTAYTRYRLYNSSSSPQYLTALTIQFYSTPITANSTAMSYIGLNNYCANTLLADSTWCNAICNSEYFESVLNVKVPKMTSNTSPEGICTSVNSLGSGSAYNVFDRNSSTSAQPNQYPCIIGYTFTATKKIYMAVAEFSEAGRIPGNFKIQYAESSSLTPGTDIKTVNSPSLITRVVFDSAVEKASFCFNSSSNGTQGWLRIKNLQFYGREDV